MKLTYAAQYKHSWLKELFGLVILFLINPLVSVVCAIVLILGTRSPNRSTVLMLFALLAAWLGCINATKTPASDQIAYESMFLLSHKVGLVRTIIHGTGTDVGREPLYGFISWLGYYVCFGNERLFFAAITFAEYYFLFYSVYLIFEKAGLSRATLVCGVLSLAFFTQFFALSIHVLRQMLATSIVLYAIALKAVDGKNHWVPLLSAPLIHSSTFLLVGLSLLPFFFRKMSSKEYVVVVIGMLILVAANVAVGSFFSSIFGEDNGAGYAMNRLAYVHDEGKVASIVYVLMGVLALLSVKVLFMLYQAQQTVRSNQIQTSSLYPIAYLCLFLIVFIVSFTQSTLIQYRFSFMTYFFIPYLLPLLIVRKSKWRDSYYILLSAFFFVRFLLTFDESGWDYEVTYRDILIYPPFLYF